MIFYGIAGHRKTSNDNVLQPHRGTNIKVLGKILPHSHRRFISLNGAIVSLLKQIFFPKRLYYLFLLDKPPQDFIYYKYVYNNVLLQPHHKRQSTKYLYLLALFDKST